MKSLFALFFGMLLTGLSCAASDEEGFVSIFNGKDLSGWQGATACYGVRPEEPGVLQCMPEKRNGKEGGGGQLCTTKEYRNFTLRFEFCLPPMGNNGLGIRMTDVDKTAAYYAMCELQLLDDNDSEGTTPYQYTGSVYGVFPPRMDNFAKDKDGIPYCPNGSYSFAPGHWNFEDVRVAGEEIEVRLNGVLITKGNLARYRGDGDTPDGKKHPGLKNKRGFIGWLGHGCNAKWRNIRIREFPDDITMDEMNARLGGPAKACAGFAGLDPRYPDAPERTYKAPFTAMFIGAHPDDADYQFGATATKLVKAGARVVFVSVCNGDKGHQTMHSEALAARRYGEAQASGKVYGVERYVILGEHDCEVEPTVELRKRVTRLIREVAPNMLVSHRTCDYHADHRATGQVVQDSTYLLGVPLFCPETPVPETLPFVMYAGDWFTVPRPFRPDLLVAGDDVLDTTLRALACHDSQLFEWLTPEYGIDPKTVPVEPAAQLDFLHRHIPPDLHLNANLHRELVNRTFGGEPTYVDAFELCEYARKPCKQELAFLDSLGFKWVGENRR